MATNKEISTLFKALGHPCRLAILKVLASDETTPFLTVTALSKATGIVQPIVSQHLSELKKAGLVTMVPDKTYRRYRIPLKQKEFLQAAIAAAGILKACPKNKGCTFAACNI